MRLLAASSVALLCAATACRQPAAPKPRAQSPATALASVSASASACAFPALSVASVVDAAGLHVRTGSLGKSSLWGFSDVGLDSALTRLQIVLAKGGAPLARLLPAGALAVVNGGYFEPDFRPSAWLKDQGVELSPKNDTSKGGVLALGGGGIYLGPFAQLGFEPQLVVQSFPLIVEQGGKPGIHSDDGRRAARTVACLVGKSLHFIVISAARGDGPTLFESSSLLRDAPPRGFGCTVALNFDGGPSSGVWFGPQIAAKQRQPLANVGYAIAILPG